MHAKLIIQIFKSILKLECKNQAYVIIVMRTQLKKKTSLCDHSNANAVEKVTKRINEAGVDMAGGVADRKHNEAIM